MDWTKPKKVAYVVLVGRTPGIYVSWEEAKGQVEFFAGACYKGYTDYEDAIEVWEAWEDRGLNLIRPSVKKERKMRKAIGAERQASRRFPDIQRRARRIVATSGTGNGQGEKTTVCPHAIACTYPACNC
jgi:ribonuclease HI